MENFHYYKPGKMEEVWKLVDEINGDPVFLAGGTDLFPEIKLGSRYAGHVIDVKGISELNSLKTEGNQHVRIGASITLSKLLEKDSLPPSLSLLSDAIWKIGSPQIRNRATLMGNICRASPASDSVPPLICLGAQVKVEDGRSSKYVELEDFYKGPRQTILGRGEMVTEVLVPQPSKKFEGAFIKLSRVARDLAIVNIAVLVELDPDGVTCSDARIVLGAVGPTVIRVRECEELLIGKKINEIPLEAIADMAMNSCEPISDVRATARYRKKMVQVLTKRGINEVIERSLKNHDPVNLLLR